MVLNCFYLLDSVSLNKKAIAPVDTVILSTFSKYFVHPLTIRNYLLFRGVDWNTTLLLISPVCNVAEKESYSRAVFASDTTPRKTFIVCACPMPSQKSCIPFPGNKTELFHVLS